MHRWLLLSYPRDYRRRRGAEILEIVRDIAPQRRGLRVGANLVRHGLRARLGRPASRTVAVWASVFALACGLFAASFGIWLAWSGVRPLDYRELTATVEQLYPGESMRHVDGKNPPAVFTIFGSPLSRKAIPNLFLEGGAYKFAELYASFDRLPASNRPDTLAQLQQRLRAAGWEFGEAVHTQVGFCNADAPRCDPATLPIDITVYARRGDNLLEVNLYGIGTTPVMDLAMTRTTPWIAYPAGVLAFLIGTLGGWSLFGWASRRAERGYAAAQALAKAMFGFAMLLWWAPILLFAPLLLVRHLEEPRYRWDPLWEWIGQPAMSVPFLFGWAVLILATGLIQLPRRRPVDQTVTSP